MAKEVSHYRQPAMCSLGITVSAVLVYCQPDHSLLPPALPSASVVAVSAVLG